MTTTPRILFLISAVLALGTVRGEPANEEYLLALGNTIYLDGIGSDGKHVVASVQGDIAVSGAQFSCADCHQRSGFGSSEGGLLVPPIAGQILFNADETRRPELSEPIIRRPAYDRESLQNAIRNGIDANGDALDGVMPRYALSDLEMQALSEYLRSLSTQPAEGVGSETIHFATIIDDRTAESRSESILSVLNHYVTDKNSGTRNEERRSANPHWYKDWHFSAYRRWEMHVWTLHGPEESWDDQLVALYGKQPVFAVVGGLSDGDWAPVHNFCEQTKLLCLLPNIQIAPDIADAYYSIYFSRGLIAEAQAAAAWLDGQKADSTVVQIHTSEIGSTAAAKEAQKLLEQAHDVHTVNVDLADNAARLQSILEHNSDVTLIAWLDEEHDWWSGSDSFSRLGRLVISSTLVTDLPLIASHAGTVPIFTIHQYSTARESTKYPRMRAWAKSRGVELDQPRIQANTYYALAILGDAVQHIRGVFSREYLIERIEHMSRRVLVASAYSKPSIAPGQRIMTKGSYLIPVNGEGILEVADAQWIVP